MNDPHVAWLRYRLELGDSLSIADPSPLEEDGATFRISLAAGILTVDMMEHHPSIESAQSRVKPYLQSWELATALEFGLDSFRFVYQTGHVIDRNPPSPGSVIVTVPTAVARVSAGVVHLVIGLRDYPPPPANFAVSPDVETLWTRFRGYKEGREPLPPMAYFCLTVLETFGGGGRKAGRLAAAAKLGIDFTVLEKLGNLVSQKGDERTARKRPASGWKAHSAQEFGWIEAVLIAAVRRLAQYAGGTKSFPLLTEANLPPLPTRRRR